MASIGSDFTIVYSDKRIYHSANTNIYTVNQLYSYLQNTFDELEQMDDPIPMTAQTPTEYTLVNGWYMNQTRGSGTPDVNCFEFLKSGAIQTSGWASGGVRMKAYDATGAGTAFASGDVGRVITETDTGDTGTILDYDERTATEQGYVWIRPDTASDTFADTNSAYTVTGSSASGVFTAASITGENLWPNIYTLGSIEEDLTYSEEQQIYIEQSSSRVFSGSEWWPEGAGSATTRHIDVLIKVKEAGSEINNGLITVYLRHYQTQPDSTNPADLYDHFGIDLSSGGRNAVPLATADDLNNTSYQSTVSGYTSITVAFVNGTVTHGAVSGGPFQNFEPITWPGAGQGIMLKDASGTMTIGNANDTGPANTEVITGSTSNATTTASANMTEVYRMFKNFEQGSDYNYSVIVNCATRPLSQVYEYFKYVNRVGSTFTMYPTTTADGPVISHTTQQGQLYIRAHEDNQTAPDNVFSPVKASPFGTFAGGKFFGAQGVWIENMASSDIQNFQLIDSGGTTRTPPNKQSITISNLLSDDRIAIFRTTGTAIDKAMYTAGAGNVTGNAYFTVTGSIQVDTPSSGVIRLVDTSDTTNNREARHTYSSWSGSVFTGLSPTLDQAYEQTNDTSYVPFIDTAASGTSVAVTVIYTADRTILVRVRRYTATAILPFETTGTFGSTGYSTAAIRTTDTIVS